MSIVLQGGHEPTVAVWRWEAAVEGRAIEIGDRHAALSWLRRAAGDAGAMLKLRRLAADQHALPGHGLDDAEVLDWLAGQIAAGRLRLVAQPRAALTSWGEREESEPAPSSARSAVTETHWITIELVGDDDKPIPGERYAIELPDSSVQEGRLDGLGLARVRGIEQGGTCKVTFPDLDEAAWTSIGTTGVP
jgi:hypothetical protein